MTNHSKSLNIVGFMEDCYRVKICSRRNLLQLHFPAFPGSESALTKDPILGVLNSVQFFRILLFILLRYFKLLSCLSLGTNGHQVQLLVGVDDKKSVKTCINVCQHDRGCHLLTTKAYKKATCYENTMINKSSSNRLIDIFQIFS